MHILDKFLFRNINFKTIYLCDICAIYKTLNVMYLVQPSKETNLCITVLKINAVLKK